MIYVIMAAYMAWIAFEVIRSHKRRKALRRKWRAHPVGDISRYNIYGLMAELELDEMGRRKTEWLGRQILEGNPTRNQQSKHADNKRKADRNNGASPPPTKQL